MFLQNNLWCIGVWSDIVVILIEIDAAFKHSSWQSGEIGAKLLQLRLFPSKANNKLHITQLCWPCTIMYLRKRRALVKIYKQARWHQNDVTWHIYRDEVFRDKRGEQVAFQHSNDDVEVESGDEAVTIVISLLERLQSVFLVHVLPYTI